MQTNTQNPPLEPDQLAAWEDDGGGCGCGTGQCATHPEIEKETFWVRVAPAWVKLFITHDM